MKKIYYLLSFVAVAMSFTACKPLDKTYSELGGLPTPSGAVVTANYTLVAADYGILPATNYAKTAMYFKIQDDAKTSIPVILASKYPNYADKSSITVTYATAPIAITPVDSVFANVSYPQFAPADYALINPSYTNLSASQIITWLGIKYPGAAAPENKLAVLTFNFFDQGVSSIVTQSFMVINGTWTKLYHISPAQYASIGKGGTNNDFVVADAPLIPSYLNALLKNDPAVSVTAKAGDVKYVSFKYFKAKITGTGGNPDIPAVTSQRVLALTYNGTNWTTTSASASLAFAKTGSTWIADNSVNYTLTQAEMKSIGTNQPTVASAAATGNLASFGNYNIQNGATSWKDEEIFTSIAVFLKTKFTNAVVDQKFNITYAAYNGSNITAVKTFKFNGTDFVKP